jgi:hypothetical protein
MYTTLQFIHSWTRWLVLAVAVWAIVRAFTGWFSHKPFLKTDNTAGAMFVGTMHLQLVLGLILYFFLSPITAAAFSNFGAAMKNPELRYWAVEHITVMILAVVVAQVGRIASKRSSVDTTKHRRAAIYFTLALVLMLTRIPFVHERLFRGIIS